MEYIGLWLLRVIWWVVRLLGRIFGRRLERWMARGLLRFPLPISSSVDEHPMHRCEVQDAACLYYTNYADYEVGALRVQVKGTTIELPLLVNSALLPNSLLPGSLQKATDVALGWREGVAQAPLLSGHLAEERLKRGHTVHDDPTYRLIEIKNDGSKCPELVFSESTYVQYVNTCEAILEETNRLLSSCYARVTRIASSLGIARSDVIAAFAKLMSQHDVLRQRIDPLDLLNRSACPGINTLTIVVGGNRAFFILHDRGQPARRDRDEAGTAVRITEALGTQHVVPAGTFQPELFGDPDHDTEFRITFTIVREYCEELLRCKISRQDKNRSTIGDILNEPKYKTLKLFHELVGREVVKLYFLGLGFDPVTLKPEICTLCLVREDVLDTAFPDWRRSMGNGEGTPRLEPFSRSRVETFITERRERRLLSAAAGCLGLLLKYFDEVEKEIAELRR